MTTSIKTTDVLLSYGPAMFFGLAAINRIKWENAVFADVVTMAAILFPLALFVLVSLYGLVIIYLIGVIEVAGSGSEANDAKAYLRKIYDGNKSNPWTRIAVFSTPVLMCLAAHPIAAAFFAIVIGFLWIITSSGRSYRKSFV